MLPKDLNEAEVLTLAGLRDTPAGLVCLKVMAIEEADWSRRRDNDPQLNTTHVEEDMRYTLGAVRGSRRLRLAVIEAQERLGIRAKGDAT
jgi:hypothetical protein